MSPTIATTALIYANGPIHLGHMVEQIQADIWVRQQRMMGEHVIFAGGNDAHGTPIMLSAQKRGIEPKALVERIHEEHRKTLTTFHIHYDSFHNTHSPENQYLVTQLFQKLKAKNLIVKRVIEQAYDPEADMFLPDRYVKGRCPQCGADEQYGDSCEHCGATYAPQDLIHARSVISGATPTLKKSEHLFLKLSDPETRALLTQWLGAGSCTPAVTNKLKEWLKGGLRDWDISRDAPYFGFEIPGHPDTYFYVWMDAPIGYMASTLIALNNHKVDNERLWHHSSNSKIVHFIGKDIIYFHGLYWPAMLYHSGYQTPSQLVTHGFVTLEGQKMSKSRGTFIEADEAAALIKPEYLRYYFATKLNNGVNDLDFQIQDFVDRIHADLIGKVVNIPSRCAGFMHKYFEGKLATSLTDHGLLAQCQQASERIAQAYAEHELSRATRLIMSLADDINHMIAQEQPWKQVQSEETLQRAHQVCSEALCAFRCLVIYLKPILPMTAERVERLFYEAAWRWEDSQSTPLGQPVAPYERLMERMDINVLQQAWGSDAANR